MDKFQVTSQHESEIAKYFHPKTNVVTKLPVEKVKDLSEVLLDNKDGSFTKHQMINGKWLKGTTYK